jgi:Sulfotransferase family
MTGSTEGAEGAAALSPREPPAGARVPDFFIAGNPKSGTTALYEMLRRHPQVFMPELKEPWFFADDMRPRFRVLRSPEPVETLEHYLSLFAAAAPGQRVGEASSTYLWSRSAAARIAALRPDARIIAILREPASFLRSLHLEFLQNHVESERDLRRALALEGARREGRRIPRRSPRTQLLLYSDHVRYVEQLRRYGEAFPREQLLVLIYEDFRDANERTVREVLRFLGVEHRRPIELARANTTDGEMRSQQLDELLNTVSVGRGPASRAAKAALKAVTSQRLRRAAIRAVERHLIYRRPSPPDDELTVELRRRYAGEVAALSDYLGRDLVTRWGYDAIG